MANIEDAIVNAKDKMPNMTPVPPGFSSHATPHQLKARLQWGEPGLTILDVRDHDAFNQCRIQGAMTAPMQEGFTDGARFSLPLTRDIYVYGNTDEETAAAANALRQAGFQRVAELQGGLEAWREIGGAVEGSATNQEPGPGAYTLPARLQEFAQERAREKRMK